MKWEYGRSIVEVVREMKEEGRCIVTVEQAENSTALQEMRLERGRSYAFVFGNEVEGVQQEVMDLADICGDPAVRDETFAQRVGLGRDRALGGGAGAQRGKGE